MRISRVFFISTGLLTAALMAVLILASPAAVTAATVTPDLVTGNASCEQLGYDFGYKPQPEPPPTGTYTFPDGIHTVTITSDGTTFDWSSTLGMDAVIVKGGTNSNVYVYDPPAESFGDTGLHSPSNASGGYAAISHIEFCYDYEVTVSKDAHTSYTRTYEWDITKTADPTSHVGFTGDSFVSIFEVFVDQTVTDGGWEVHGTITIENATPFDAEITGVSDVVSSNIAAVVDCGVGFPHTLIAGGTLTCAYSADLPNTNTRLNTVTVTTTGVVGGGSADADVIFGEPTIVGYPTINVTDSVEGSLGSASGDQTFTYEHTFTCSGGEGSHQNIATITETGESADAWVTVDCYDLSVTKDASTAFDRSWSWKLDKAAVPGDPSANLTTLTLSEGQMFQVNYSVTVNATPADSDHAVSGSIHVTNPAPIDAELTGVSDLVSPDIAASVNCGVSFPFMLMAGDTLDCTYSALLPDAAARLNTATATLQNYAYPYEGTPAPNGTTGFSGSADVIFSTTPTHEYDECVDVSDTNTGVLGTVCAEAAPATFNYSLWFSTDPAADVVLVCGENSHLNTASFVTNDTGATGSDTWTVLANVTCEQGCTLTPGYWKTHSSYGPAHFPDDTWLLIGGPDMSFYLSGSSYYNVLWTPPQGNPYYILAHAYIAAELNILNGASTTPEVDAAMAGAADYFDSYMPSQILRGSMKANVLTWATLLDSYNNGLVGPGHCTE